MFKRKTQITTETERRLIYRRRVERPLPVWCEACARPVQMVTPEEAAAIAGLSARHIYRQAEAGRLHFTETPRGALLICLNSVRGNAG
jgi:hypothetical protein